MRKGRSRRKKEGGRGEGGREGVGEREREEGKE